MVPSASTLRRELIPFNRTRMLGHPCVERIGILHSLVAGHNLDRALWINLHPRDTQACGDYGLHGTGHVALAETGRPSRHGRPSKLAPSGPMAGLFSLR